MGFNNYVTRAGTHGREHKLEVKSVTENGTVITNDGIDTIRILSDNTRGVVTAHYFDCHEYHIRCFYLPGVGVNYKRSGVKASAVEVTDPTQTPVRERGRLNHTWDGFTGEAVLACGDKIKVYCEEFTGRPARQSRVNDTIEFTAVQHGSHWRAANIRLLDERDLAATFEPSYEEKDNGL